MKRKTFTLIEILGVMAIIAILATLGFAGYSYANNKAKETATQGLISRLDAAFEMAQQKSGFLPPAQSDFSEIKFEFNNGVVSKLIIGGEKYNLTPGDGRKSRMEAEFCKQFIKALEMDSMNRFMENNVVIDDLGNEVYYGEIVDAWGNKVYYRYPGKLKKGGFDLISAGSDGSFGAEVKETPIDDISKYRDGADWICDDIANF